MGTKIPCLSHLATPQYRNIKALPESTLQYHAFWSQKDPEEASRKDLGRNGLMKPEGCVATSFRNSLRSAGASRIFQLRSDAGAACPQPLRQVLSSYQIETSAYSEKHTQNNLKCNPLQTALLCCLSCNLIGIIPSILILSCCR